ncbi:MAG: hypothetical protein KAQ91_05920 [Methylococcales bacterium]|nr:hypothetical protein [Methylococcales bacterium]
MLDLFGFSLQTKMLIRLYAWPMILLLFSLLLQTQAESAQVIVKKVPLLTMVGNFINIGMLWGSLLVLGVAVILFLYESLKLWHWYKGSDDEVCHVCTGMVSHRKGKYGPYYKCLACGSNRSVNR